MKATQPVDICNLALSLLSNSDIVDITDASDQLEKIMEKWYDRTLRETLAMLPWNFAKGRFLCPQDGTPAFGYSNQFLLPNDYIRLNFIGNTRKEFVENYQDYSVEGRHILLDANGAGSLPMQYTRFEERVGLFSPWFVTVLVYRLALNASPEVNRTSSEIQLLQAQFEQAFSKAAQYEGQENPVILVTQSKYKAGVDG